MSIELLLNRLSLMPWAVHPGMLDIFTKVINNKLQGEIIRTDDTVRDSDALIEYSIKNGKAIIPLHGVVMKRSMGMQGMSGMVTTLNIENTIQAALDDPKVESMILDIDSPGGTVDGTAEVAAFISDASRKKPIVAYANGMMASAAYWIASAADEIYGYYTSHVGSIGVYLMHVDQSEFDAQKGVKISYIKAGKYKTVGNPHEPLTDEGRGELQTMVDTIYDLFINNVALYRGADEKKVRTEMAEGRIFLGEDAVKVGLIDQIVNFNGLVDDSNIYSFLTGGSTMFEKVEKLTADELKAKNPELYEAIKAEGHAEGLADVEKVQKELDDYKADIERKEKIVAFATKIGLKERGLQLAEEGKSVNDAYETLANEATDASAEFTEGVKEAFEQTAPPAAGQADPDESNDEVPQTQVQAMEFCRRKYNCNKAEGWRKARREFTHLFIPKHNDSKGDD